MDWTEAGVGARRPVRKKTVLVSHVGERESGFAYCTEVEEDRCLTLNGFLISHLLISEN